MSDPYNLPARATAQGASGPSERVWRFCDDPAHAWIRAAWTGVAVDPRLPLTSAVSNAELAR